MKTKYNVGDIVYIIANQIFIKEAKVVRVTASTRMYTLKFTEQSGRTKLHESRLFGSRKETDGTMNRKNLFFKKLLAYRNCAEKLLFIDTIYVFLTYSCLKVCELVLKYKGL